MPISSTPPTSSVQSPPVSGFSRNLTPSTTQIEHNEAIEEADKQLREAYNQLIAHIEAVGTADKQTLETFIQAEKAKIKAFEQAVNAADKQIREVFTQAAKETGNQIKELDNELSTLGKAVQALDNLVRAHQQSHEEVDNEPDSISGPF